MSRLRYVRRLTLVCASVFLSGALVAAKPAPTRLAFLGGVEGIGASATLVETAEGSFLVDFGAPMGPIAGKFPDIKAKKIAALVLTHAHLDHSGWLPELVRDGFKGPIWATEATCQIVEVMWKTALRYERHASRTFFRSRSAKTLHWRYDCPHGTKISARSHWQQRLDSDEVQELGLHYCKDCIDLDLADTTALLRPVKYEQVFSPVPGVTVTFLNAGHILGSASALIRLPEARIVFSGDLGNSLHPFLAPPQPPREAEYAVIESTYGAHERTGDAADPQAFVKAVTSAIANEETVIIPAYVLDRTQKVIALLQEAAASGALKPNGFVFLTNPSAQKLTRLYRTWMGSHKETLRLPLPAWFVGPDGPLSFASLLELEPPQIKRGVVYVTAPSDGNAGHCRRLLEEFVSDPKARILTVGYAEPGSAVARIADAAAKGQTSVQAWDDAAALPLRAKVESFPVLSGHADAKELESWCRAIGGLKKVFIVHGEAENRKALAIRLTAAGFETVTPSTGQRVELGAARPSVAR